MSEEQLLACVLDLAKKRGWLCHHVRPLRRVDGSWRTAVQGDPGFFDLVMIRNGEIRLIELKSARGRLTAQQRRWCVEWMGNEDESPEWFVWRPRDWHSGEIERALR